MYSTNMYLDCRVIRMDFNVCKYRLAIQRLEPFVIGCDAILDNILLLLYVTHAARFVLLMS